MAFNSAQIAMNAVTATPLLVQGSGAGQFKNIAGNLQDALPVILVNADAAITIYVGGPGVTAANGLPLLAGASLPMGIYGTSDIPYGIAASGTPVMAVFAGRQ